MVVVGIIGGSGIDDPQIMSNPRKEKVHTPYGAPSDLVNLDGGGIPALLNRLPENMNFEPE